jgi:UV DNA damage repair endonuclease
MMQRADCYCDASWIEVEAKQKEQTIVHLRQAWLSSLLSNAASLKTLAWKNYPTELRSQSEINEVRL